MNKIIASGCVGLLAGALGSAALAADMTVQASQMRANKIIGTAVYDRQNQDVASVKDLVLDQDGKVDDVVLSYGTTVGLGGKYVAVPFSSLKYSNDRLTVDKTKEQLAAMPAFRLDDNTAGSGSMGSNASSSNP